MVYLSQTFYKAHGSAASWEWLEMIAPCVNILRELAKEMHSALGSDQGVKHHPPDLTDDIQRLADSLDDAGIYEKKGRTFDHPEDLPTKDVVSVGLQHLGKSLAEYNATFKRLQARRRRPPVVPVTAEPPPSPPPASAGDASAQNTPSVHHTGSQSSVLRHRSISVLTYRATIGTATADLPSSLPLSVQAQPPTPSAPSHELDFSSTHSDSASSSSSSGSTDSQDNDDERSELEDLLEAECGHGRQGRGPDPDRLRLESAADVALDMDVVEVEEGDVDLQD
jgi:hypothetical protein